MPKPLRQEVVLRNAMTAVRVLGGAVVLAILVWQVGTGPFVDAVRLVDRTAIVVALAVGGLTTLSCAWRWRLVAAGLGVALPLRHAVTAYYRSQFLNATLPGGVAGDVHRAVRHGLDLGDIRLATRAVVTERLSGQAAQVAIAVGVLFALPSPVQIHMPVVVAIVALGAVVAIRWSKLRGGVLLGVILTSAVVLAGHLAIFLLAARTSGATAPLALLVPLTLLALMAMALPLHIAGWGLREGVAAWAFGAAGLTATQGVTTAATYGVLATVACLPGAGVLVLRRRRAHG